VSNSSELKKIIREYKDVEELLKRVTKKVLKSPIGQQELEHASQVAIFAYKLGKDLKLSEDDLKICLKAAILHDIGRFYKHIKKHTDVSEKIIYNFLDNNYSPIDKTESEKIYNCIRKHSTSSTQSPSTILEKILFDADNLTIFTWFGVKRWFFKAESWGHSKSVISAEKDLVQIKNRVLSNQFFYLKQSIVLAKKQFYFTLSSDFF